MEPIHISAMANGRDLILLAFLLFTALMGAKQGLLRTIFGLLGKLLSLIGAAYVAKIMAKPVATFVVTPIVGNVFRGQAAKLPQAIASSQAAQSLEEAIAKSAVSMAEGIAYLLLFVLLSVGFSFLLSLLCDGLTMLASLTPFGFANRVAGFGVGLAGGVILLGVTSVVLQHTSPELFTGLGWLSPVNTDQTVLMRRLLEMTGAYL